MAFFSPSEANDDFHFQQLITVLNFEQIQVH